MTLNDEQRNDLLEELPLSGIRGVIARRLTQSLHEMAQLTLHRRVEAARLAEFRDQFDAESRPSLNCLVLAAVAHALTRHPLVNATLEDETISRWRRIDLGMAVAVDAGLLVPVIRHADRLSLAELQHEADRLSRLAREGRLAMTDIQDGTFTVSNLGSFGIDGFTPIVNPPQVAILGVGRLREGAMELSLTIDHRALDGVPGARFLEDLANVFDEPGAYLQ